MTPQQIIDHFKEMGIEKPKPCIVAKLPECFSIIDDCYGSVNRKKLIYCYKNKLPYKVKGVKFYPIKGNKYIINHYTSKLK